MWTLRKGEAPYGYLGPLLGRGADGGFGEIGLCKSRLGEIIPVTACLTVLFALWLDRQESDESFQGARQRQIRAQQGTYALEDRGPSLSLPKPRSAGRDDRLG